MILAECAVFVVVFVAVCAAFALGRGSTSSPVFGRTTLQELHSYDPAIEVFLEYRNETGFKSLRRVHITRSQYRHDGRLYLIGYCHRSNGPRTFRADRIICFATQDGEVLDKQQFLMNRLAIPAALCTIAAEAFMPTAGGGQVTGVLPSSR
jgi:hypothetical protein